MSDLSWTSGLMDSESYRQRFFAEYWQTKIRYEKLKNFCNKIEAANISDCVPFVIHDCPEKLLKSQLKAMSDYLHILEVRAIIEAVDLEVTTLNFDSIDEEDTDF